jgi:hypothetical protein
MTYRYRADVLDQLLEHGVRPLSTTPPALVHDFVSDLYRYELRRLKQRLARREFPQPEYFGRVVELRQKYPLVSVPLRFWTKPGTPG